VSAEPHACHAGRCVTCADEAVPMRVLRVDAARELALCAEPDGGARRTVDLGLVGVGAAGDTLLVHAGVAIARLGEAAA
jgi:hydrogenase expression/formation protein HypC